MSFFFSIFQLTKWSIVKYKNTNKIIGGRRYWPAGRMSSSPLKTAKPTTATELEDISREISAAMDQPRQPISPVFDEENKNVSIFTKLFGMKQEKVK